MNEFPRPALLASAMLAAVCLASAVPASAEPAGIVSHKLDPDAAREAFGDQEPVGPFRSRLPIIDEAQLSAMKSTGPAAGGGAGVSSQSDGAEVAVGPTAHGLAAIPYTTARVAVTKPGFSKNKAMIPVTSRPYSTTGKLYIRFGAATFVCTASLVRKGVLVTAAHCVSNFGAGELGMATAATWYPSQFKGNKKGRPFGGFNAINIFVPSTYLDGTDTCDAGAPGVVCNNDIATIALAKQKVQFKTVKGRKKKGSKFPGQVVGTYLYGFNGYSYVTTPADLGNAYAAQITQLGYPVAFDGGNQMQRTDSIGFRVTGGNLVNTWIGSAQTGGSSGGPWLANFGTRPKVSASQASLGFDSTPNVVVGVTSYGVNSPTNYNFQGASFFGQNFEYPNADYGGWGAGNIGALLWVTCQQEPASC